MANCPLMTQCISRSLMSSTQRTSLCVWGGGGGGGDRDQAADPHAMVRLEYTAFTNFCQTLYNKAPTVSIL